MSNRLDWEREARLQPRRMDSCEATLRDLGFDVRRVDPTQLEFTFNGRTVKLWPYSGWFTGKTVADGRGFEHLLHQIQPEETDRPRRRLLEGRSTPEGTT